MSDTQAILSISRVIPVAVISKAEDAVSIARALLNGGVGIIEVTLRTRNALTAIENISREVPEMSIGAGTVWTRKEAKRAIEAGAQFLVSPGRSDGALKASKKWNIPYLPGAQTVSEVAHWQKKGLSAVKFFPASIAGGIGALKAFGSVFPDIQFCPTGGINATNAADYLALPNVPCLGGSWLLPRNEVENRNWKQVELLAREATLLGTSLQST